MEGSVIKTKAVLAHQHLRGVNDQDKFGCLPIHYACQHSKEDTLELVQLVSQGCDVNTVALPTVCEDSSSPNDERDKPYLRARGQAPLHIASRAGNLDVMNFLLKNADPLLQNSVAQMQTPLHVACMCGNVDVAKLIMSECGDEICNVCDTYQCLPLHYACQHASLPLVKLVSKGCRATALSRNKPRYEPTHGVCQKRALDEQNSACGQTPLHLASITGQSEVVKYLFEECLDDKYQYQHLCNCFGQTLLHVACLHGHMEIVKSLLIKCGFAMCKVKDLSGSLPAEYASKHDSLKLLKLSSISRCTNEREAFEEWPDVIGQLHLACRSGIPELVEYLINIRKCNPEESFYDQTAFQLWPQSPDQLHTACKSGIPELVQYIYRDPKRQCDIEFKNDEGMVAFELWPKGKDQLHKACRSGVPELVKYLVNNRCCSMDELINDQRAFEMWPDGRYHDACKSGVVPLVKYLCENQRFVTSTEDHREQLPLHVACQEKSLEMVKLVSSECDVNTADTHGFTPLHIACKAGEIEIAMYLVSEKRASIKLKDTQGNIPFDLWPSSGDQLSRACAMGFPELTHYLIAQRRCEPSLRALELWPEGVDQLHKACKSGIPELVKYLLDERCCNKDELVNDQIAFKLWPQTPEQLHDACKTGIPELVQHIYRDPKRQCDIEFKNDEGMVGFELWPKGKDQLHRACRSGVPELVKYLVNNRYCSMDELINDQRAFEMWPDGRYHDACKSGVVPLVKYLCENQRFVTSTEDHRGQLPLHVACQEKSLEMVKLVSNECNVNITDNNGFTPVHIACKDGEIEIAVYLVSEKLASIMLKDTQDNIPFDLWPSSGDQLSRACAMGFPELTHYLIKQRRCEPSLRALELWPEGVDQLHKACKSGIPELVKYLVDKRCCDKDKLINDQIAFELWPQTPDQLHDACKTGVPELVQHVYQDPKRQCDIERRDSGGMVAFELWPKGNDQLHKACRSGVAELVRYLIINRECDINARNSRGKVPFDYWPDTGDQLQKACAHGVPELVHYLINHRKCTSSRKAFEMWPEGEEQFHSACESGILELVKYLIQEKRCGKYINKAVDFEGSTPLHVACDKVCPRDSCNSQYTELIKFLTVHGHRCPNHVKGDNTDLPLHIACCKLTAANVKLQGDFKELSTAPCKCDIHIPDKNGQLPLHIACHKLTLADVKLLSDFDKLSLIGVNTASRNKERPIDVVAQRISSEEDEMHATTQGIPQSKQRMSEAFEIMCFLVDKKKCNISAPTGEDNVLLKVMTMRSKTSKAEKMRLTKLMITGAPGVGKSSFREHLVQRHNLSSRTIRNLNASTVIIEKLTQIYAKATLEGLPWEELGIGHQIATLLKSKDGEALRKALIVHILDTGGQPGLHKLLPALVNGPAIYLVFFTLHEKLWERSVREFVPEGNSFKERYVTSYTSEDVIFQTISTVSCFTQPKVSPSSISQPKVSPSSISKEALLEEDIDGNTCSKGVEPESSGHNDGSGNKPVCVLVGTHKDKVDDDQIEDVNDELENMLGKIPNSEGLIKRYNDKIVAPISNTDREMGIGDFGTFLTALVHEKCQKVEVRPEWLSFQLCIAQSGHDDVITLAKCRKIAKNCGMEGEDYKDALTYLHYHVGSVLWYRQVPEYEKLLIVNIQSLYDSITDFMANTFTEGDTYYDQFVNKGQFTSAALHEKSEGVKGYYVFSKLIHLLVYLHIAACVSPPKSKPQVYFMPSVLRSHGVELSRHSELLLPHPLLIYFDYGFCPVGMFGFFIVELLKCSGWQLCNSGTQYSNMILMRFGKAVDKVQLIEKSTFYEVRMEPDPDTHSTSLIPYRERCFQVKNCINKSLEAVRENLKYDLKLTAHKFAFFCPRMECQKRRNNIAVEEIMHSRELNCLACKNPTPVPDTCKYWYGDQVPSISAPIGEKSDVSTLGKLLVSHAYNIYLSYNTGILELKKVERPLKDLKRWYELGLQLGLFESTLQDINLRYPKETGRESLYRWLKKEDDVRKRGGCSWRTLVAALRTLTKDENVIADAVEKQYLPQDAEV